MPGFQRADCWASRHGYAWPVPLRWHRRTQAYAMVDPVLVHVLSSSFPSGFNYVLLCLCLCSLCVSFPFRLLVFIVCPLAFSLCLSVCISISLSIYLNTILLSPLPNCLSINLFIKISTEQVWASPYLLAISGLRISPISASENCFLFSLLQRPTQWVIER